MLIHTSRPLPFTHSAQLHDLDALRNAALHVFVVAPTVDAARSIEHAVVPAASGELGEVVQQVGAVALVGLVVAPAVHRVHEQDAVVVVAGLHGLHERPEPRVRVLGLPELVAAPARDLERGGAERAGVVVAG